MCKGQCHGKSFAMVGETLERSTIISLDKADVFGDRGAHNSRLGGSRYKSFRLVPFPSVVFTSPMFGGKFFEESGKFFCLSA